MILLSLSGCFGPTLLVVGGGYKITTGDIIAKIVKIMPESGSNKEDYENKKL
jgi:hypothetical protein